jgi:Big-like domain-containing protein
MVMKNRFAIVVLFVGLAALGAACGSSTPTAASTVSSVTISGTAPAVGSASQFTATATLSDGSTMDVTGLASWSSSDTSDVIVSTSGVVTGVAAGSAIVSATYSSVTGSLRVAVS